MRARGAEGRVATPIRARALPSLAPDPSSGGDPGSSHARCRFLSCSNPTPLTPTHSIDRLTRHLQTDSSTHTEPQSLARARFGPLAARLIGPSAHAPGSRAGLAHRQAIFDSLTVWDTDPDSFRECLDNFFAVLDGDLDRDAINRFTASELGHLQSWIRNRANERHIHYNTALAVRNHFTHYRDITKTVRARHIVGAYRIENATVAWTYNTAVFQIERNPLRRGLSIIGSVVNQRRFTSHELAHWDGAGSATISARRARMHGM